MPTHPSEENTRAMARAERDSKGANGRRGNGRGPGLRRLIAAAAFMPIASRAPLYASLLWSLLLDSRTPVSRKALLGIALGYIALGRDVVPDGIPLLGQLDDLVVVALAIELFLDGLDESLLREKLEEAGIPRTAYDEDVARVRRLVPGPLRRTARRIPGAIQMLADAIAQSGIQPRVRGWIARGSIADLG
jgi:uncharacterized membrane protein YkvA (DUF1232 family)